MGDIADSMIYGEVCSLCGTYLRPREEVYSQHDEDESHKMPKDGSPIGFPVICKDCKG